MDSRTLVTSQNGDNRQLTFNPELRKITRLGDLKGAQIIKSPSWPSSPTIPRSEIRRELSEHAFWTLGRKRITDKVSNESFRNEFSLNDSKKSPDETFKEIHSILSSMDLAKYYLRGRKDSLNSSLGNEQFPLRRSLSVQPQTTTSFNGSGKKSFLDGIPPPPKTKSILEKGKDILSQESNNYPQEKIYSLELSSLKSSQKQVNSKLKELTERLRPASAPPSPHRMPKYTVPRSAPPMSNFSFWKDPLPIENSFILPLNRMDQSFKSSDDFSDDQTTTKSKENKISKPTRKNNFASFGYATLPRTKVLETQNEPRTLASLDLNINFQTYRENQALSESDDSDFSKNTLTQNNCKHREVKEIGKGESKRSFINENICLNKTDYEGNQDISSPYSSRRGSLKNSSNTSPKKADFDLNFSKYGSLNSSRVERRRSVGKKDTNFLEKNNNTFESKKCSLDGIQIFSQNEISATDYKPEAKEDETVSSNDESKSSAEKFHSMKSDGTKSVPVLPSSFSNPLEDEIRTIAKLLDGKESLFLKLIQSSKIENEASKQAINSYREAITPKGDGSTDKSEVSSGIMQKVPPLRGDDRNSPTRVRAMTVPGTETNRSTIANQTSPPPQQKRFYKKRLRGPYGEMLENEMSKSFNKPRPSYAKDLDFLKELENSNHSSVQQSGRQRQLLRSSSHSFDETHSIVVENTPKRKTSANIPLVSGNEEHDSLRVPSTSVSGTVSEPTLHIRSHSDSVKTSSAWNVDTIIAKVLKNSSQQVCNGMHLDLRALCHG
ncbi:uncharacterized protein TNCV_1707531 [Trichonephila clavipes]|uniref:Uncharacterized protein n=1 Tax=Trichonephila clavipes TaxID=2585209 RepID=A0A8X6V283_TRICX|nr:uncharacterized protein TNCV_1707531 [Trichonephila clavipes]